MAKAWTYRVKYLYTITILVFIISGCSSTNGDHDNQTEGSKMNEQQNKLADETSPYLLQHAHNPVNWYPWGEEAFAKAKAEDKPIFLSIGYSSCHWCHVMAHESFENDSIAALMNKYFVSIKVDREERPDIDEIYMTFIQMTTGSGGWPMSVWLTPDRKPFFGGTYFPPEDRYGRRGFPVVLQMTADAWQNDRQKILQSTDQIIQRLQNSMLGRGAAGDFPKDAVKTFSEQMLSRFDKAEGGFGGAPKFPPSYSLSLMMRYYYQSKDEKILQSITHTLDKMAYGGMYDQLGGGFHRYSVDARWLVPHFEKMLYDNALLAYTYFEAYQLTQKPLYRRIGTEILEYVMRDMTDKDGGFYSAEDADSEGEEGKFYLWNREEIYEILGEEDGKLIADYYDVTKNGNFENGESILHVGVYPENFTKAFTITMDQLEEKISTTKTKLMPVREKRIRPGLDDKILTDWNGLMLSAFAKGYQVTNDRKFLTAGLKCADFIEKKMYKDGKLLRTYRAGKAKIDGMLSDYAFLGNGIIDLYEASFDLHLLKFADKLGSDMIEKFYHQGVGGFYMTIAGQDDLLLRQKDFYDGAIPSGNSAACLLLVRLSAMLDNKEYYDYAEKSFHALGKHVSQSLRGFAQLINAYDFFKERPREIAIVGDLDKDDTQNLLKQIHALYIPNKIVALLDSDNPKDASQQTIPLLKDRVKLNQQATAYVCENFICKLPVNTAEELRIQLLAN